VPPGSPSAAVTSKGKIGPLPPDELPTRVGIDPGQFPTANQRVALFEQTGRDSYKDISSALPDHWAWAGKSVLDFGCGSGRVLRWFLPHVAEGASFTGCDLHASSIAWMRSRYPPGVRLLVNKSLPPLPVADGTFHLIYCASVFSHLTVWAPWLAEMHRLLRPDGLLVASIHGRGFWHLGVAGGRGVDWQEDRIGLHVERYAENFSDSFGPAVYASEWWLRSHWGRIFDIVRYEPTGFAFPDRRDEGQAWIVAHRRAVDADLDELERPEDPRELEAVLFSRQLVLEEIETIYLPEIRRLRAALDGATQNWEARLREEEARSSTRAAELAQSERRYAEIAQSKSWRLTAPLRALARWLRDRRGR